MAEGVVVAGAALEIAATTTNIVRKNLPAQKIKGGFSLLYNGMLLLHEEFDNLPTPMVDSLLATYDLESKTYKSLKAMKLGFPKCLAHPKAMIRATEFYTASKQFEGIVKVSSSDARHERAMKARREGRPLNELPTLTQQMAILIRSWGAHLDQFQRLEEMRMDIESKLSDKNPASLSSSSSSTIHAVVNDSADSGYISGQAEVPSSPIILADRESGQVGHEEEEYIPGLAGLGRS
ncbi:hypothetical protein B0H10DRAFT_2132667 [Mycena sp. CBHHK59/15]|nr:hypothetical protein B0H10DRAFT_2132667 [Mycena sp. CBHHK59/15]